MEDYQPVQLDCREVATGRAVHGWRTMLLDGAPRVLVVDADDFATRLLDPAELDCEEAAAEREVEASRYGRALFAATEAPFPTRNDGVTRATERVKGLFLSIDLCPAPAGKFADHLFAALTAEARASGRPVPVALAVTADWMARHGREFDRLVGMQRDGVLAITWVNHSATHPYQRGLADAENFLLTPGTDAEHEVLATEVALLERGQVPSPFFRFPGLVSDRGWVERLATYSLVPLGSDGWLANGQEPREGSVILVHGNGNEPAGVAGLLRRLPVLRKLGPFLPISKLFGGQP